VAKMASALAARLSRGPGGRRGSASLAAAAARWKRLSAESESCGEQRGAGGAAAAHAARAPKSAAQSAASAAAAAVPQVSGARSAERGPPSRRARWSRRKVAGDGRSPRRSALRAVQAANACEGQSLRRDAELGERERAGR
jgi:hypothetical protein